MTITPFRALAIATVAASIALAAPACAQKVEKPQYGGTVIFSLGADPTGLNPSITTNVPDRQLGCTMNQGLIDLSPDLSKVMPLLAKSWTISPDGKTYSFDLVHTNWHDGKPFTSEDVKYSIGEVDTKYSSTFAPAGNDIESIDTPAPDKVIFHLKEPFGPFMTSLACQQGSAILPAHIFNGTDIKNNPATMAPVGTGPFKFVEWKHDDHVTMDKNADYFEPGKPYLDKLIAKVIPLSSARLQALATGEIDYSPYYPVEQVDALRADPKLQFQYSPLPPAFTILFFNTTRKPFDDKRVRQALFMATDRDYIFKHAYFSVGEVSRQPFPSQIAWAANPKIDFNKMYPYDIAKANALLDAAGLKRAADGKRFTTKINIFTSLYPEFQQVTQSLKSMWAKVGVDVTVESLETAALGDKVYVKRDFDITLIGYSTYADPALGVARAWLTSQIGKLYGNPTGWSNAEMDKLFDEGAHATTFAERAPFYQKAQAIAAEELPVLSLREYRNPEGASRKLHDLWARTENNGTWQDAWLEK